MGIDTRNLWREREREREYGQFIGVSMTWPLIYIERDR
jgi:hypothetical protein